MSINNDIAALYEGGVKFVVISDAAILGCGHTPSLAWADALSRYPHDELYDAQCFDAAPDSPMISDWRTRDAAPQTIERT